MPTSAPRKRSSAEDFGGLSIPWKGTPISQNVFLTTIADMERRCTTVKLNRPRSVDTAIITVDLPSILPALDVQQAFNNVDHQLANARLMKILDRVEGHE